MGTPITRRSATAMIAALAASRAWQVRAAEVVALRVHSKPLTDDFDGMLKRGRVRVLVPYSRTLFFEDKGRFYGITADFGEDLENYLRHSYPEHAKDFEVVLIPTSRDRLLPDLLAGEGDLAAGDVTITPEREKQVAFTKPMVTGVKEVVITRAGMPAMASADDLSGKDIAARPGTSTYESLLALNKRLTAAGRPPAKIRDIPATLEVEDMMEMVAAGLLPAIPAEEWVAKLWSPLIPGIMIHGNAVLRSGASLGFAVRPTNPKLLAVLNTFIAKMEGKAPSLGGLATYYMKQAKKIYAATSPDEMKKFDATLAFFEKYGPEYGFDSLMLVAQGYQESHLDQSTHSPAGAIGLMQLLPATGNAMGVGSITQAEANVHAGAMYMRHLLDVNLKDAKLDEQNRTLFAFACYNAGPAKIARLRSEAKDEGLNEDVWFDNVERIAARRIGQETVRYVRNIYKYYIGYKLVLESRQRATASKEQVKGATAQPAVTTGAPEEKPAKP